MFSVAGAIEALADMFVEPSDDPSALTSPQWRSAAIAKLENDADLSDSEQVKAICLFSRNTFIVDLYLAISKKTTRTLYIQSEMDANLDSLLPFLTNSIIYFSIHHTPCMLDS